MSKEVFASRTVDPDTRILSEKYQEIDGIPVLSEMWCWEGYTGCSFIVPRSYVAGRSVKKVVAWLRRHFKIDSEYTFSEKSDFLFINYAIYDPDF